ncbi:pre-60S ribosomal particles component [Mactra antiquata]
MAASIQKQVHVEYDGTDSGSEGDSEGSVEENEIGQDEEIQEEGQDDETSTGKKGLADVLAKILHKKVPNKQQVILAKGKTDKEILKRKLEREEKEKEGTDAKVEKIESQSARAERIKLWENMCRSKPDPLNRQKERNLQKVATRGVVQLFNAVRKQQKVVEEEIEMVGKSERKKDKVMEGMTKDKFLSILKGTANTNVQNTPVEDKPTDNGSAEQDDDDDDDDDDDYDDSINDKKWGALRDDYMMGAKIKDWGKQDSDDDDDNDDDNDDDPDISDSD